jgi:DNA-binding Lrp family transcriptional regulator
MGCGMKSNEFDILDFKIVDVYNRLKRIEDSAVIRHYSARLDLRRILPLQTFFTSIWLEDDRPDELRKFERQVLDVPEIVECAYITGTVDYMLKTVAADLDSYLEIINAMRESNSNIRRYETSAQVREVKFSALPLERLVRRKGAVTRS